MREVLVLTKNVAGLRGNQNLNLPEDGVSPTVGHGSGSDRLGRAALELMAAPNDK
jgi:hypothetical protein